MAVAIPTMLFAYLWFSLASLNFQTHPATTAETDYFAIQVVDAETGRGVPLVELKTTNQVSYWTDSAGCIALHEPALWNQEVYFHVASHGYEFAADGFGYRGVKLTVEPGATKTVELQRINIAERLYRVTGSDIYRDSHLLGRSSPVAQPLNNANVTGSDSVLTAVYRGKIYWFWGDTNLHRYPLGIFHVPGATSDLPNIVDHAEGSGGQADATRAEHGIALEYFLADDGNAKSTCEMPGDGPTWIEGLTVISEDRENELTANGASLANERMFATYAKIKPPLDVYERGLVEWNNEKQLFERKMRFGSHQAGYPMGHPVAWTEDGQDYIVFCRPLPLVRVLATASAILDPTAYEVYSCMVQTPSNTSHPQLERHASGQLDWRWRRDGILPTREWEDELVRSQQMQETERLFRMTTAGSPRKWTLHSASISWNEFRQRWMMLGLELAGETSFLGELYYTEAEQLLGPWSPAVKVVTHDKMTFYNPREHSMLSEAGGRYIFFEGTYTHTFSNAEVPTPRYDYNQIMYRLDLSDPRLHPQ